MGTMRDNEGRLDLPRLQGACRDGLLYDKAMQVIELRMWELVGSKKEADEEEMNALKINKNGLKTSIRVERPRNVNEDDTHYLKRKYRLEGQLSTSQLQDACRQGLSYQRALLIVKLRLGELKASTKGGVEDEIRELESARAGIKDVMKRDKPVE